MNADVKGWLQKIKIKYPKHFTGTHVLEIGAADINGTTRDMFDKCEYIGIDVKPFKGVDVVSVAHEYPAEKGSFDVVYCMDELEHDKYWELTLKRMVELVRPGGLMIFMCAGRWATHGTTKLQSTLSLTTQMDEEWANYYRNLNEKDICNTIDINGTFREWEMGMYFDALLGFWGVKKDVI